MKERLQIPYPVIVEGRYDKLRLETVMEGNIFTTDGFGLFRKEEKKQLFRALAKKSPLILLTDSDGAGKLIRSAVTSWLPKDRVIQLYIPKIAGKERRKEKPSAEGTLGVEGMEREYLYTLLRPYADPNVLQRKRSEKQITKTDFFLDGLTGAEDSSARRDAFAERIGLPSGMTPNALLAAVQMLCSYEEYCALAERNADR